MMNDFVAAFRTHLAASHHALLLSHLAPDGDALGSSLGLMWLLRGHGLRVSIANQDPVPPQLRSEAILPGWQEISGPPFRTNGKQPSFDLIVALDSSDLQRLGAAYRSPAGKLPLVVIDHHITNTRFGTLNLVDSEATSAAEIVVALADALGWPIGREAAQCLLTGIITDTRGFRIAGITPALLGVAQRLMEAGASLNAITEGVLEQRSLSSICLWGKALADVHLEGRVLWAALPVALRRQCPEESSDAGLTNFLIGAEEADVAVLFSEREADRVEVSMRAAAGFNVAQVALALGGGGHPRAAGCTVALSLAEAQQQVLATLQTALAEQRKARTQ